MFDMKGCFSGVKEVENELETARGPIGIAREVKEVREGKVL